MSAEERMRELLAKTSVALPELVPGGYPVEAFERGDLDAIADSLHAGALELMRRNGGGLPLTAYVFARRDVYTMALGDCLYMLRLRDDDDANTPNAKELFGDILRGLAVFSQARGVAVLCEAWTVQILIAAEPPPDSLEHHPNRREVVWITLESESEARGYTAEIKRRGRSYAVGEFECISNYEAEGRLTGIMRTAKARCAEIMTAQITLKLYVEQGSPGGPWFAVLERNSERIANSQPCATKELARAELETMRAALCKAGLGELIT